MNNLQNSESSMYFSNETESDSCDLLMAKILGQYSKEYRTPEMKEQDEKKLSPENTYPRSDMNKKLNFNMWHSVGPIKNQPQVTDLDDESVHRVHSEELISEEGHIVKQVLSKLKTDNNETLTKQFRALSSSPEGCSILRQCSVLPMLIQLIHGPGSNRIIQEQASLALHSIVKHNTDEKHGRREAVVLKLIEEILEYCESDGRSKEVVNPDTCLCKLMKLSFDVEYRRAMCQFGALHALAKLIQTDHEMKKYSITNLSKRDVIVRRYALMSLTNLTFGDSTNKSLLCSLPDFMRALVAQLESTNEDLCQDTAAVLRNLSWRASTHTKDTLQHIHAVKMLMKTVQRAQKESTLKPCLSALWNLSAHNDVNKVEICKVDGAIDFLAKMLNYHAPSGSLVILENVGGILRNISKLIAVNEDFRATLRKHNCLINLLEQLKSHSLVVVKNACGTLWNLTARCEEDQRMLIRRGGVNMLRSLTHSKHKMISAASTAALKNLMSSRVYLTCSESTKPGTLAVRKQRALQQEMDMSLRDVSYSSNADPPTRYDRLSVSDNDQHGPNKNYEEELEIAVSRDSHLMVSNDFVESISKNMDVTSELTKSAFASSRSEDEECEMQKNNGYRKVEESYNEDDSFGNYTETDIDEPTNYSLRFSEQISDSSHDLNDSAGIVDPSSDKKVLQLETPLMYSRSSSIGSISCGEPVDDQGSVLSEFSRAVSGIISPSELPDSPTQTVPPSPYPHHETTNAFYTEQSEPKAPSDVGIFQDTAKVFKEENTPSVLSMTTSLNSLTFDNDTHVEELTPVAENKTFESEKSNANSAAAPGSTTNNAANVDDKENSLDVHLSLEEQQAIVEACIVSGIPTPSKARRKDLQEFQMTASHSNESSSLPPAPLADSLFNYCTEDTPISITQAPSNSDLSSICHSGLFQNSHAASNSDLSLLCPSEDSFLHNSILPLSVCVDDHSGIGLPAEEQEKLLDLCIAKGKQTLSSSNTNFNDSKSSQSSTLSEITDDLALEDRTLLNDMVASANLISMTENDCVFLDDKVIKELSEEEEKNLLNQCIVLGMPSLSSMKGSTDLENIGPPSFLAEANLDSSLTNVEEITDYPPCANPVKSTPKQKRREMKERYQTYTVKEHKFLPNLPKEQTEIPKKSELVKERKSTEKDRFKTRILSASDFEEIARSRESKEQYVTDEQLLASPVHIKTDDSSATSESESCHDPAKAKIVKPVIKGAKSGIPVVGSKLPMAKNKLPMVKSPVNRKKSLPCELPVPLQRQNTFTKDEPSGIPVKKTTPKGSSKSTSSTEIVSQFKSNIPSRIKEPSSKVNYRAKNMNDKSADIAKNRWSISENNLDTNVSVVKTPSNTSLNTSASYGANKVSPSVSHSALPVRRESSKRSSGLYAYKK